MSKISSKLASEFDTFLGDFRRRNLPAEPRFQDLDGVHDVEGLVEQGYDPNHATYIWIQNLASWFAERMTELPEFDSYCKIISKAEDEYMPDGPPISPLTRSFFTAWAFFDVRFGRNRESIGSIMIDLAPQIGMDAVSAKALRQFQSSRMGVYEHAGLAGSKIRLRELWTDKELVCHVPVKHRGKKGELWFTRLCPSVTELTDYHVVWGTPYILKQTTKKDWIEFLNRSLLKVKDKEAGLHRFLKYGRGVNYWNEFVFAAYCGHTREAVFLTGVPDIRSSLPHAD